MVPRIQEGLLQCCAKPSVKVFAGSWQAGWRSYPEEHRFERSARKNRQKSQPLLARDTGRSTQATPSLRQRDLPTNSIHIDYRVLRWIGYLRPELNLWVWSAFWKGHVGGWRLQAVLDILEVTGRVSGRAGCLHENTFVRKTTRK